MVEIIPIKLPAELLELTGLTSKNLEEKSLLIWILDLYADGKISLSKAANLLDMKVELFLAEFYRHHLRHADGPDSVEEAQKEFDFFSFEI
jgi:predicted HTH domain antitoxin